MVWLSDISVVRAPFRYSISEIVDDMLRDKMDREAREYAKNRLGIEYVYKSYDLSRVDFWSDQYVKPHIAMDRLYRQAAGASLDGVDRSSIGMLITVNDNPQYLDPAPATGLVPQLSLRQDIRAQNLQGLACSALPESLLNAAGHFAMGGRGDALLIMGSSYTEWFLDRIKQIKHITRKSRGDFYSMIYFLIFSDAAASAIISSEPDGAQVRIDPHNVVVSRSTRPAPAATLKISPDSRHRMIFDMSLDPRDLRDDIVRLAAKSLTRLQSALPDGVEIFGIHTAGKKFVDSVAEGCNLDPSKIRMSYDIMSSTGNMGALSSIQFVDECIRRDAMSKGDIGCFIDYGWEGAGAFAFERTS
jgi:3-oxoacyl-[acyl-carrier-protein] synthase III